MKRLIYPTADRYASVEQRWPTLFWLLLLLRSMDVDATKQFKFVVEVLFFKRYLLSKGVVVWNWIKFVCPSLSPVSHSNSSGTLVFLSYLYYAHMNFRVMLWTSVYSELLTIQQKYCIHCTHIQFYLWWLYLAQHPD